MNATLEFDLDDNVYRAYVKFPTTLKQNKMDLYYWSYPETVNGYGSTLEAAVFSLRRRLEERKQEEGED